MVFKHWKTKASPNVTWDKSVPNFLPMNISVALAMANAASELAVATSESPIFIKILTFECGKRRGPPLFGFGDEFPFISKDSDILEE